MMLCCVRTVAAQGAAPETAPTLFPGGALVSFDSFFTTRALMPAIGGGIPATARPTVSNESDVNFTWGFHPDFDLTVLVPVVVNRFDAPGATGAEGAGLGDAMALFKYRFYRRDSARGTTQASVTVGPRLPTGRTNVRDGLGRLLPAGLQPGSGSTDLFVGANWTYTGLLNLRRLVADEDFHFLSRSQGSQETRLGSDAESRFWLSYRPYESADVGREWFIGPAVTWIHSGRDRIADANQTGTGGDVMLAGITTYLGLRPGMHAFAVFDWDVAHSAGAQFMPVRRSISFGITQQFRMHLLR